MIPTPLAPDAFVPLAYASTTMLVLAALVSLWGWIGARALLVFAASFAFGVGIEALGERTGFPFGAYTYTAPGPSVLGVPLLVPLGWFAFTVIALAVSPVGRARLFVPLALVAWDVGLDPLMVREGFWTFAQGPYFGVAWSNFAGWALSGFLLVNALLAIEPRLRAASFPDLRVVYLAQAFLIGGGLVFFGMPLAGLIAAVAMTSVAFAARAIERRGAA